MNGKGVIRSLGVAVKHFFNTYIVDLQSARSGKKRYYTPEGIAERSSHTAAGIFTIQYPEEKLPVPEEFRYIPFLVYEEGPSGEKNQRCTSCGICAKVCPPQCIWIERTSDPVTGRPVPSPANFYIDVDICMNCGFCAEYCPFDAIKMDHDYEIATYDRHKDNIYDIQRLSRPVSYYAKIRPVNYAREEAARQAEKEAKAAKKAGAASSN
jgi:NADH-quinone oxidoreductase subunit I